MSVTNRVFLDPARMPSTTEWARAIRAEGFAMDLDVNFDPETFSGFLPCVHQGHPSGFEYFYQSPAAPSDARRAADQTCEVAFVTHSDLRELVAGMIASGVLALLSDGVVWSDESGESFSARDAVELARETERELPHA